MIDENFMLWHKRLGHANMHLIQLLAFNKLVRNLPKLKFDQHFCDACKIRKQAYASHKAKNIVSTNRCLELLHMDLYGPSAIRSYGGNRYTLVIVDDYSRYTWTRFLKDKTKAFNQIEMLTPRTPHSNDVVKKKNRTLQEMSRTMLNEQSLPQKFWCNAVDTSTYILNRILIRAILGKTPYKLLKDRKPTLDYFRVFGSKCFILNTKNLTKFDPKSYEGIFLGYFQNSKAYIILNKHTRKVEESLNVTFNETPPPSKTSPVVDDDLDEEEVIKGAEKKNLENNIEDETLEIDEIVNIKESRNHPLENVIRNLNQSTLRSQAQNQEFAQVLDIPCEGACVVTDKWSLNKLVYGVPTDGLYQTNPSSPDDIILYIQIDREGQVQRIRHEEEIDVHEHQILTREAMPNLKPLEEIIQENVFYLGSERLERIVAQEEVVTSLLLPPPSTNHPPLILMIMMMEMTKGPRVEALFSHSLC
nr:retrovirus-related Pol polyprotein from transposon TNT 1-94 [Tanacetum cinerariifolium]